MIERLAKAQTIKVQLDISSSCVADFTGLEIRASVNVKRALEFIERERYSEASAELLSAAAACALEAKRRSQ